MRASLLSFVWRRFRVRAFRDRELEHEFRQVFRSAGVRFFEIAAALTGLAYIAFFLIYAISGSQGMLAQPQPLRLVMIACMLATALSIRLAKGFVGRHYEIVFPAVVVLSITCTTIIASMNQATESPYSRYWGLFSAAVIEHVHHLWLHAPIHVDRRCSSRRSTLPSRYGLPRTTAAMHEVMQRLIVHLASHQLSFATRSIALSAFVSESCFCAASVSAASSNSSVPATRPRRRAAPSRRSSPT